MASISIKKGSLVWLLVLLTASIIRFLQRDFILRRQDLLLFVVEDGDLVNLIFDLVVLAVHH